MVRVSLFVILLFASSNLEALVLDKIFQFNDATSLKSYVKNQERHSFLKILCKKQKENKIPPIACYKLSLPADLWCLSLKLKNLSLEIINLALKSKVLSSPCRNHLMNQRKILLYRQKDFLLPELKNYWTSQKSFP